MGPTNYLYLQSNELAANATLSAYASVNFSTIVSLTAGAAGAVTIQASSAGGTGPVVIQASNTTPVYSAWLSFKSLF